MQIHSGVRAGEGGLIDPNGGGAMDPNGGGSS